MTPYIVLGVYKPTKWRAWKIGKELTALTESRGLIPLPGLGGKNNAKAAWNSDILHAEVRLSAVANSEGTSWHQDGDTTPGANMDHALVLWSNRTPTEFKVGDKIFQPKPFEVVVARNLACSHRRPNNAPSRRWSFRQRVIVPKELL